MLLRTINIQLRPPATIADKWEPFELTYFAIFAHDSAYVTHISYESRSYNDERQGEIEEKNAFPSLLHAELEICERGPPCFHLSLHV